MSDSVQLHRQQPTRLPRPWDSSGKNTRVGCHVLLQCMRVKSESEVAQLCLTLHDSMDCSLPGSSVHGIFQARVLEWGAIAFSYVTSHAHGHKRFILALYYFPLLIYLISKVLQFKTYPSFIPEGCEKLYTNLYKRINRLMDECTD